MNQTFITTSNVYDTAQAMMELDMTFIKLPFQQDAEPFIRELHTAIENFRHPFKVKEPESSSHPYYPPILAIDKCLTTLLTATKNFYGILTEEGKWLLKKSADVKMKETKALRKYAIESIEKEASLFYE